MTAHSTDPHPASVPSLEIEAPAEGIDGRTDRFLAAAIPALSRSRIQQLMIAGHVLRDGTFLRDPAAPVRPGGCYRIALPPPRPAALEPEPIPFPILHEDDDLIVLDKPAGLVVHPAPGHERGTLVQALLAHCGNGLPGLGGERRPGIVHRLDRDTSGVMVVAKTEPAMAALSAAFAARDLDRAYLALCWGLPAPEAGELHGAIGRDPRDRKRMAVVARGGRPALTRYRTARAHGIALAQLECRLATGRTHQIRVHLAQAGHPVVGDPVYLRRTPAVARALPAPLRQALLDFPRQALHAASLGFRHPRTGRALSFQAPPPPDLSALLGQVWDEAAFDRHS